MIICSGNSASGVARNCDYLADAISTVNIRTRVRCVLDGPSDFNPFWIQDIMQNKTSSCGKTVSPRASDFNCQYPQTFVQKYEIVVDKT